MPLTAATLRRLTAYRVAKYMEHADGTVLVEFFPPADHAVTTSPTPTPREEVKEEETADEWIARQYQKPDGV